MLFFLNLDGTVSRNDTERVFQGQNKVASIELFTLISPAQTSVQVAFTLPNGLTTTYLPMAYVGAYSVDASNQKQVHRYILAVPYNVTEAEGQVGVSFNLLQNSGTSGDSQETISQTTYTSTFTVEYSALPIPPTTATETELEQLLNLLQLYYAQNASGVEQNKQTIADLKGRATILETDMTAVKKTLAENVTILYKGLSALGLTAPVTTVDILNAMYAFEKNYIGFSAYFADATQVTDLPIDGNGTLEIYFAERDRAVIDFRRNTNDEHALVFIGIPTFNNSYTAVQWTLIENINIGTIETKTLPPGTPASVEIQESVGSDLKHYLNFVFGIPQGAQGTVGNTGATGKEALVFYGLANELEVGQVTFSSASFNRTPIVGEHFIAFDARNHYADVEVLSIDDATSQVLGTITEVVSTKGADGVSVTGVTAGTPTVADGKTTTPITFALSDDTMKQVDVEATNGTNGTNGVTPDITINASVDDNVGTPEVEVVKSGTPEKPTFSLRFKNLKGENGEAGVGIDDISSIDLQSSIKQIKFDSTDGLSVYSNAHITDKNSVPYEITALMRIPIEAGVGISMDVDADNNKLVVKNTKTFNVYNVGIEDLSVNNLQLLHKILRLSRGRVIVSAVRNAVGIPVIVGYNLLQQDTISLSFEFSRSSNQFEKWWVVYNNTTEKYETEVILDYTRSDTSTTSIQMQYHTAEQDDIKFTGEFASLIIRYYSDAEITLN